MRHVSPFFVTLLSITALGCAGSPDDLGGAGSTLVEVAPGTEPLAAVGSDAWQDAPPSCDDRLSGEVRFELASAAEGLVAAVDTSGDVVCVDSLESVQEELEEEGREEDADHLGDAYLVAIGFAYVPDSDSIAMGDPSPQPSTDPMRANGGSRPADPSPQPSTQASQN